MEVHPDSTLDTHVIPVIRKLLYQFWSQTEGERPGFVDTCVLLPPEWIIVKCFVTGPFMNLWKLAQDIAVQGNNVSQFTLVQGAHNGL